MDIGSDYGRVGTKGLYSVDREYIENEENVTELKLQWKAQKRHVPHEHKRYMTRNEIKPS